MYLDKPAVIFDAVDKVVYEIREDKRRVARNGVNQRLKPEFLQWGIGEWVMYSTIKVPIKKDKMRKGWKEPWIIVGIAGNNVYIIEDPWGAQTKEVHAHRLRFYEYAGYAPSEEVKEAWIHDETGIYNVQEIIGIRDDRGDVEVLVWWQGFEKATAEWHPYTAMKQDVPAMVHEFLRETWTLIRWLKEC
jgi:hypothetical protein